MDPAKYKGTVARIPRFCEDLVQQRQKHYGPPLVCHANIGEVWGGLLAQADWRGGPVPPHVVAAMMAALKLVRAVTGGAEFNGDSFDDAAVYVKFAHDFHPHNQAEAARCDGAEEEKR